MKLLEFEGYIYTSVIVFICLISLIHLYWIEEKKVRRFPVQDEIKEIAIGRSDIFYMEDTE